MVLSEAIPAKLMRIEEGRQTPIHVESFMVKTLEDFPENI